MKKGEEEAKIILEKYGVIFDMVLRQDLAQNKMRSLVISLLLLL